MAIKYGVWSDTRIYQYTTTQSSINVLSHTYAVPLVSLDDKFVANGSYVAAAGSHSLRFKFADLPFQDLPNFVTGAGNGDWALETAVPDILDAGFQTFTIQLETNTDAIVSKTVGFWFKQIDIVLTGGESTKEIDQALSDYLNKGIHISLMGMPDVKWNAFVATGLKVFVANDYNAETNTGTWQDITSSDIHMRQDLSQQYKKMQIAIKLSVPLPLPEGLSFELSSFAYMLD